MKKFVLKSYMLETFFHKMEIPHIVHFM